MGDAAPAAARFSAFISYSHADAGFVARLHSRLESYRLPRRLRSADRPTGKLAPLFMDRAELSAAPSLSEALRAALASSERLIVVCSPEAAASAWVALEIKAFRELRPGGGVLAALCRGEPSNGFPPSLLGEAGQPPLAADFRKAGDGPRLALLKLVAPMAGVALDQLVQRDAQRQSRRSMAFVASAAIALAAGGAAAFMLVDARSRAAADQVRGEQMVDYMIGDERARLKAIGRVDLLDQLNATAGRYFQGRHGQMTDADLARRAELWRDMAEDDIERGDFAAADAKAGEALATTTGLLHRHPRDRDYVYDQAQSEFWSGFGRRRLGDAAGAQAAFRAYADLASELVHLDPNNPDDRLERGYALSNLATLLLQHSRDLAHAGPLFAAALDDFQSVAHARPDDRNVQLQVEDAYAWLAEIRRLSGDEDGALRYRQAQRAVILRLIAADPRDATTRLRLATNDLAMGRVAIARGDLAGALATLAKAHAEAAALAANDPENTDFAQEARAADLFTAQALLSASSKQSLPSAQIERLIGDWRTEARSGHAELATFCRILRARLLRREGQDAAADAVLPPSERAALIKGEALSERWLIDWGEEMRAA